MKLSLVLKALSHPIRREIITRLREGPQSAGALAEHFDVSKPTMSVHFAALKEADLVYAERKGVSIVYHLNATVAEEAITDLMGMLGVGETEIRRAAKPALGGAKKEGAK